MADKAAPEKAPRTQLTLGQIEICLAAIDTSWKSGAVRDQAFAREVITTEATLNAMKAEADG